MISLFVGLFTVLLILDCLILGLLVLMQLPKKDAGVGVAFGGGTADALFGAGSGNLLTKLTKYFATFFFVLVLLISMLKSHTKVAAGEQLKQELSSGKPGASAPMESGPVISPTTNQPSSNALAVPLSITTNISAPSAPAASTSNTPAAPHK